MKYKILRTIKQMPIMTEAIVNLCARVDQVSLFISSPSASANLACNGLHAFVEVDCHLVVSIHVATKTFCDL